MSDPEFGDLSMDHHSRRDLSRAEEAGLLRGPKTRHLNAEVTPALFEAAARKVGDTSPAAVITAGLAALAMRNDLGPWLAANWGVIAAVDPELVEQIWF